MSKHRPGVRVEPFGFILRPLKNIQFCARSRKTKILATGIHGVFRGLKFESDAEMVQKGTVFNGLNSKWRDRGSPFPPSENRSAIFARLTKYEQRRLAQ